MSCRPNIEVESKREFLAHINLGFKSEYEFENGSDCYEFITKELGVNENEYSIGPDSVGHERFLLKIEKTKEDKFGKIGDNTCDNTDIEDGDLVAKGVIEENLSNENNTNKTILFNKTDKIINNSEICTHEEETHKTLLDSITKAVNFNNIEIIYEGDENENKQLLQNEMKNSEIVLEEKKNYQCYICNKKFLNKARRRKHLTLHFKGGIKLTTCPFCGKSFTNKNELNTHFTSHLTKLPAETLNMQCKICNKTFTRIVNLTRHVNRAHGKENVLPRCNLCSKVFNHQIHLENHMFQHTTQQEFKCNVCQKLFLRIDYLIRHLKTHPATEPYKKCEICYKQFSGDLIFENHYAKHLISLNKSNYNCHICGKSCLSMFLLNYHLKIKHRMINQTELSTEDYPTKKVEVQKISCFFCSMKFRYKSQFENHLIYHSKNKKFKCKECSRAFFTKYHLQIHMAVHTAQRQKHECPICLKLFTTKYSLREHLQIHDTRTKFNCIFCNKIFYNLSRYMTHRKIHKR